MAPVTGPCGPMACRRGQAKLFFNGLLANSCLGFNKFQVLLFKAWFHSIGLDLKKIKKLQIFHLDSESQTSSQEPRKNLENQPPLSPGLTSCRVVQWLMIDMTHRAPVKTNIHNRMYSADKTFKDIPCFWALNPPLHLTISDGAPH